MHQRRQLLFGFSSLFFIVAEMNFEDDQDLKLQVIANWVGGWRAEKSENISKYTEAKTSMVSIHQREDVVENSDKF